MSRDTSRLERLPTELLWRICEYVGHSHRPTLLSVAMASKRCHSVAKRLLFHTIKFSVGSPRRLAQDVIECTGTLQRNAAFADVRTLVITDSSKYWGNALPSTSWFSGLPLSLVELIDDDQDRLQGLDRHSLLEATQPKRRYSVARTDADWQALARLVQNLPALADVLYACSDQFPLCLLQVLLQHHPRCRLHHFTFQLHTLHLPATDSQELALVTAPCLYSIWMQYEETDGYDDEGVPSYHAEAVDSMVRGLAPNLREVHMFQYDGCPEDEEGNPLPPRPPWKGLIVSSDAICAPARLECLELGTNPVYRTWSRLILEGAVVDAWAANTKLSLLRNLMISRAVSHKALDRLMRVGSSFHCLTTLLFTCAEGQEQVYYDDVKQFLCCLPQLTSLEIIAWHPSMSLISALHPRLRELWLRTQHELGQCLDEATLAELADRCPAIETLALKIRRSRGDATEVALYRALGRFPRLRRLALTLDASPPPWFPAAPPAVERQDTAVDSSFDEFDRRYLSGDLYPYRNGHIRDVLINTAVDETLARAIFQTVCAVQARNYTHGVAATTAPLERMTVQVEGGRAFPHRGTMRPMVWDLILYIAALGRRWLLERDVRDDARDVVHAREIDKEGRLQSMNPGRTGYPSTYLPIFRRIWPETPGGTADWWDDWRSYPLITED